MHVGYFNLTTIACVFIILLAQYFPSRYSFSSVEALESNGSSPLRLCNSVAYNGTTTVECLSPDSSVLFDGIPTTLTGLDGNMWASQLLTLQPRSVLTFDFTGKLDYVGVGRIEVVMFNCPQWGISVQEITSWGVPELASIDRSSLEIVNTSSIISCESLVRVCIPLSTTLPVIFLVFTLPSSSGWVYLAEVEFYSTDNSTCPPLTDPIITTTPPPTPLPTEGKQPISNGNHVLAIILYV